jgi:hypothetical protein
LNFTHSDHQLQSNSLTACFVVTWFGSLPKWLPYFLASCEANPTFNWLLATDQEIVLPTPQNVRVLQQPKREFEDRVSNILDVKYNFSYGYKLCDLKPVYGHIYQEELTNFNFWGYCDLDVIFGRLDQFISKDLLGENDVITSLDRIVAGHFTLLRNTDFYRTLYRKCDHFCQKLCSPHYEVFDELTFSLLVKQLSQTNELRLAVVEMHAEDSILKWKGRRSFCFFWNQEGLVDCVERRPMGYFHFIQSKSKSSFRIPTPNKDLASFFVTNRGFVPVASLSDLTYFHLSKTVTNVKCLPWYSKQLLKRFIPNNIRQAITVCLPKRKQD